MKPTISATDYLYSSIPECDSYEEYLEACRQIEENNLRIFNENFEYDIFFKGPYEPVGKIQCMKTGSRYGFKTVRGMEAAFKKAMYDGYLELGVFFSFVIVQDLIKKAGGGSNLAAS
jgi:hypothetical protein